MLQHYKKADIYFFTGTGNTLLLAESLAEAMEKNECETNVSLMEKGFHPNDDDALLGLCFPVAYFSSYPTVLDFIKNLPKSQGRPVFLAASMGGVSLGMEGPIKRILLEKGYRPLAARFFLMPSNYDNKEMPVEANKKRIEAMRDQADAWALSVLKGQGHWGNGIPLVSNLFYRFLEKRKTINWFYKHFPLTVDTTKCTQCGRCTRLCPTGAIQQEGEYPKIHGEKCQSCQRCIGFCPVQAIHVPGKPAGQYCAVAYEAFQKYVKKESYSERRERLKRESAR